MISFFAITGPIGLVLISVGVLVSNRELEDILYIFGGIFLGVYSIQKKDTIFITLQVVFTIAAVIDLIRHRANLDTQQKEHKKRRRFSPINKLKSIKNARPLNNKITKKARATNTDQINKKSKIIQ
jgi:hypothetical protein